MNEHRHVPDLDRLSVVIALILLAYATTSFVAFPTQTLNLQLPGFLVVLNLSFTTIVAVVVAVLAAAGADWIITGHPHLQNEVRWHHWIVPAFTAIAIGIPLGTIPVSGAWWIIFGLGGILMIGVLSAEYISVDANDVRYSFAVMALNAVSLALFLVITTAISGGGYRLYILMAAVFPAALLIAARTMHLRLVTRWNIPWAFAIALIVTQIAAALFYLPLGSLQFGMILLGVLYGLISAASNIEEKHPRRTMWIEPVVMTTVFFVIGFLVK